MFRFLSIISAVLSKDTLRNRIINCQKCANITEEKRRLKLAWRDTALREAVNESQE